MNLRQAWSTNGVQVQPGLAHRETLSQKNKQKQKISPQTKTTTTTAKQPTKPLFVIYLTAIDDETKGKHQLKATHGFQLNLGLKGTGRGRGRK